MAEWKEYKLKDVIEKFIDYRGKTPKKTTEGIPLITAKIVKKGTIEIPNEFIHPDDYESWMTRGFPKVNDVVMTTEAPLGEVALIKNDSWALAQRIITMRGNPDLCNNIFFKYYLQSRDGQAALQARASGSTVEGIKASELREMTVFLPDIDTQESIGDVLISLDNKIDLLHRQNQTLEAMAETLFRQWFIEKAEESWEKGKLPDLVELNPKRTLKSGIIAPYLEMGNVSNQVYHPENWYDREFSSGTKFINGDTLLARITPCLENGKSAYVDFLEDEQTGWGSTEYIVMRPKPFLHTFFSYILTRNNDFRNYAISSLVGSSGRQRVDIENLANYEITIPPQEVLDKFNDFCTSSLAKMKNNHIQIRTLTQLRDTLLPKLMSGEVRVGEN